MGRLRQKITGTKTTAALDLKWGKLRLATLAVAAAAAPASVHAQCNGGDAPASHRFADGQVLIAFAPELQLAQGHRPRVTLE